MARMDVNPLLLSERIQLIYMAVTGKTKPFGAYKWASSELGIPERTLGRWLSGDTQPPKMFGLLLDYIEQYDIGDWTMRLARERLDEYNAKNGGQE